MSELVRTDMVKLQKGASFVSITLSSAELSLTTHQICKFEVFCPLFGETPSVVSTCSTEEECMYAIRFAIAYTNFTDDDLVDIVAIIGDVFA
jgi:hypothetical protein